jgi:DNA-binding transcriptional regulator YiaG
MSPPSKKTKPFAKEIFKWRRTQIVDGKPMLQKQAAEFFGVPKGTYRCWEKGSRTPNNFVMGAVRGKMAG